MSRRVEVGDGVTAAFCGRGREVLCVMAGARGTGGVEGVGVDNGSDELS